MTKKVIHILGAMNIGGVESWLMALLRNTEPSQIRHEIIVHTKEKAFYDEEIHQLGSKIYYCEQTNNPLQYALSLYKLFKSIKPDVVHSHVHTFSGFILMIAWLAKIKIRISHSHSDTRSKDKASSILRQIYLVFMKILISIFSTTRIAVSPLAAECLYGTKWSNKKNCSVIVCGIDHRKYNNRYKDLSMFKKLGIPTDRYIIGHVGRFAEPKNHKFLIDVFYSFHKINNKAYLVLVGDGPLKEEIQRQVYSLGIQDFVKFTGLRNDVPKIMLSIFDILLFPSLWEGLPLTLVEAQLANKRVIASENITELCDIGLITFKKLIISEWVEELQKYETGRQENFDVIKAQKFYIDNNIKILDNIYRM